MSRPIPSSSHSHSHSSYDHSLIDWPVGFPWELVFGSLLLIYIHSTCVVNRNSSSDFSVGYAFFGLAVVGDVADDNALHDAWLGFLSDALELLLIAFVGLVVDRLEGWRGLDARVGGLFLHGRRSVLSSQQSVRES